MISFSRGDSLEHRNRVNRVVLGHGANLDLGTLLVFCARGGGGGGGGITGYVAILTSLPLPVTHVFRLFDSVSTLLHRTTAAPVFLCSPSRNSSMPTVSLPLCLVAKSTARPLSTTMSDGTSNKNDCKQFKSSFSFYQMHSLANIPLLTFAFQGRGELP